MTCKTVLLAGVIAAIGAAGPAQATVFTLKTTGAVGSGTDALGLFGPAGGSLPVTPTGCRSRTHSNGASNTSPTFEEISGPITGPVTATVNGITTAIPVTTSLGARLEAFNNGNSSELLGLQSGTNDANGQFVSTTQEVLSPTVNVTGPRLTNSSYTVGPADFTSVSFTTSLGFTTTSFNATASTISLAAVVPEPASLLTLWVACSASLWSEAAALLGQARHRKGLGPHRERHR